MNKALQTQKPQKMTFSMVINSANYQKLIANSIHNDKDRQNFVTQIVSAVANNPQLSECTPGSILAGALLGFGLRLSPSPQLGQYYLVPFNDRKAGDKKAQFILGYKGYLQLAIRSGQYRDIDAMEVREGEYLGRDKHTGQPIIEFIEDDDIREQTPVIGYMAYFEYLNGFAKTLYWSKAKMMSHADKYSSAFSAAAYQKLQEGKIAKEDMYKYSSYWYSSFDDMAKKTLLRQLISKWGIMSIEMQQALETDTTTPAFDDSGDIITTSAEPLTAEEILPSDAPQDVVEQIDLTDEPFPAQGEVSLADL
jgi:recombination protein RecT